MQIIPFILLHLRFTMVTCVLFAKCCNALWIYFANFPHTYVRKLNRLGPTSAARSSLHFGGLIIFQINEFFEVSVIAAGDATHV